MTGGLSTIARFARAFPDFTRSGQGGKLPAGVSAVRPWIMAGALGWAEEKGRDEFHYSPYWLAMATLPLLSGPARSLALSRLMQATPKYEIPALLRAVEASRSALPNVAPGAYFGSGMRP